MYESQLKQMMKPQIMDIESKIRLNHYEVP